MQILEIEKKYAELKTALTELNSKRTKLLFITEYFSDILPTNNSNLTEAYIVEFIPDFLKYIRLLEIRGLDLNSLSKINEQLKTISGQNFNEIDKEEIFKTLNAIDEKFSTMNKWLSGVNTSPTKPKIYFPVLEKNEIGFGSGYLESINVEIKNGEQKFHISPSEYENDGQLDKQIALCFSTAINYCKKFIPKIKSAHTVYLHFENKLGLYTGNSLGIALTLLFIEAILKHYNSKTIVNINGCIAVTGGIDNNSKIISTSKAIIEIKTEAVFYSDAEIFCVPKVDELWAEEKLLELYKKYPDRNLKIVGLTDLNDLLDRRQIVDIRKQTVVKRTGKFIKKNWISAAASVLLAVFFSYIYLLDWDNNPDSSYADGNSIHIINKNGRTLLSIYHSLEKSFYLNPNAMKYILQLRDIDGDGANEILYVSPQRQTENKSTIQSSIMAIKNLTDTIWTYTFRDSVFSEREILSCVYSVGIIDRANFNGIEVLICFAQNTTSFSNAVFLLDVKTGKRINKTHWCSGHITGGMLLDVNKDGIADLVLTGIDNGYEDAVIWGVELDKLDGYRLTVPDYIIKNKSESKTIFYIRFPKNDFERYIGMRTSSIEIASLSFLESDSLIRFLTNSFTDRSMINKLALIEYQLKPNLLDFDLYVGSGFRVLRDTLVAKGMLNEPYTDTKEYIEIQKQNILYWHKGKWIKRNEFY